MQALKYCRHLAIFFHAKCNDENLNTSKAIKTASLRFKFSDAKMRPLQHTTPVFCF